MPRLTPKRHIGRRPDNVAKPSPPDTSITKLITTFQTGQGPCIDVYQSNGMVRLVVKDSSRKVVFEFIDQRGDRTSHFAEAITQACLGAFSDHSRTDDPVEEADDWYTSPMSLQDQATYIRDHAVLALPLDDPPEKLSECYSVTYNTVMDTTRQAATLTYMDAIAIVNYYNRYAVTLGMTVRFSVSGRCGNCGTPSIMLSGNLRPLCPACRGRNSETARRRRWNSITRSGDDESM